MSVKRHCPTDRQGLTDRYGLTMLEVIVSLTLTATILFVSLNASGTIARNRTLAQEAVDAQRLGGYFLDEISVLPIYDADEPTFGLEPDESTTIRTTWDDVDDYHNFEEVGPSYRDGTPIPGFDDWFVEIEIDPIEFDGSSVPISTGNEGSLREVQVHLYSPSGDSHTFRTIVSSVPDDLSEDQSFERLRRIELDFSSNRRIELVVPLRNRPAPIY
ncbi:MAG: hypothetical protein AAFX06_02105 [Planctomycetota bacterium]